MRTAMFVRRMFSERSVEVQRDIYLCSICHEKACDQVQHEDLINISKGPGGDRKDLRIIIIQTISEPESNCKSEGDKSELIDIKHGVRQGCVLLPHLPVQQDDSEVHTRRRMIYYWGKNYGVDC